MDDAAVRILAQSPIACAILAISFFAWRALRPWLELRWAEWLKDRADEREHAKTLFNQRQDVQERGIKQLERLADALEEQRGNGRNQDTERVER